MAKITISIVTYNGAEFIGACLKSVQAQTFEDFELIIVDNASQDDTLAQVRVLAPQAKIISLPNNVGFGAGHNIAVAQATAPWVLVLNQDVTLKPDCLERLFTETLRGDVAAIGPCLLRSPQESPGIIDTAGLEKTWYYHVSDRGTSRPLTDKWQRSGYVWGVSGACVLLRKTALQQIAYQRKDRPDGPEYFDETFFLYKEDVDMAARFRRHGWKAWYEASAVGYHQRTGRAAATRGEMPAQRRRMARYVKQYSYRNHWFLLIKHAPLVSWLFLLPYEAAKFVYVLLLEPSTLKYAWQVLTKLPVMIKRRYELAT